MNNQTRRSVRGKREITIVLLVLFATASISLSGLTSPGPQRPAFPGAEGFGAATPGGRGGRALLVTNLNDSGPGSFRAACDAEGPRIVIFRVSGLILLTSPIVGASLPVRDSVDTRIIEQVRRRTGSIIDSQKQVGGWPEYRSAPPPADSDGDGMPDEWEIARGLDPRNAADASLDRDGDGYSNIEEYINELAMRSNPRR